MAQLVLTTVAQAIGSRVLGRIGAAIGRTVGETLGRAIDQRLFGPVHRREGPRLNDIHIQSSSEGASIPAVYGRVRIAGQVIWAARFKEHVTEERSGGGKGGGPRNVTRTYRYSLSFAVGLCEGRIARLGRVWANGEALDMSGFAWRLHRGEEDQAVDPLIEAIEGHERAPAYRGLAYVVFEDLPLERFGNMIPQLSFEIVRPSPVSDEMRFEDRVEGVCLIPGAGEFVYAPTPVFRSMGPGAEAPENVHAERGRANLLASLDQLQADFPNCRSVLVVTSWFGTDLRCGQCSIRPGVEIADKETAPLTWRAGGVGREGALLVSRHEGAPAYGGTPSDRSVIDAIAELKSRGFSVGLYPFVLMDVPAGNTLADPYGPGAQAPYPWRGRITVDPASGRPGSPDKTQAAAAQVASFFGAAQPGHVGVVDGLPAYSGPAEWSYRRFILHYARLAALAGGVDAFILGSELRGLTGVRDGPASFPAVAALRQLAADVRSIVGGATRLTYAADWSEYGGHRPPDGSGDVIFHLDPLWADANIDVVGVDWYPPLADWRDGETHLDAALARHGHDRAYLESRIEAGECYDWHYASDAERGAQTRSPIADGAHGEPWIYRAKDVRNFWARRHYDRIGGVRASTPTAWIPQSKPIWFVELGCPAVDKGANAPNLFVDPKSAENAVPPFSTGTRDDVIQRRALDAYLRYWGGAANPRSDADGRPMIERQFLWCWDARPHPAFPARSDVWADASSWRLGHWLNGRAGLSNLGEVVLDLCRRVGVEDADASRLVGAVSGYVAESPASARELIEPLMAAYDFDVAERDGRLVFFHLGEDAPIVVGQEARTAATASTLFARRADAAEAAIEARVRFLDPGRDYQIGAVSARRLDRAEGGVNSLDAPLALEPEAAERLAQRLLAEARAGSETATLEIGPGEIALEPGDCVRLAEGEDVYIVSGVEDAEARRLHLRRARARSEPALALAEPRFTPPAIAPAPLVSMLETPPLDEDDERPLVALFASPWVGAHEIYAGAEPSPRATVEGAAAMGELAWDLWAGPVDRWDDGNVTSVRLYGGALESVSRDAALNGANVFAVESDDGEWEILQAADCVLTGPREYRLSGLLRGRLGSAHAMRSPHPAGARIVKLDRRLARLDVATHEWGEELDIYVPPAGASADDERVVRVAAPLLRIAARAWAPAHLRAAVLGDGGVAVSWVRCARLGGDGWGAGEPPLDGPELYQVEILDGSAVRRTATVTTPSYFYPAAERIADLGASAGSFRLRVAQIDRFGRPGLKSELTITL